LLTSSEELAGIGLCWKEDVMKSKRKNKKSRISLL